MLNFTTCQVMAMSIVQSLVAVGRALQEMFAAIRAKIIGQTAHKNQTEIVGSVDVEITNLRVPWSFSMGEGVYVSGSGPISPAHVPTTRAPAADIEIGVFNVVVDQSSSANTISGRNANVSTSPLSIPKTSVVKVIEEPIHSRTNQRPANFTRDMVKTFARVKRHPVLFGKIQKPGLADFVFVPSENLTAPNAVSGSELQQRHILCSRTIGHKKLFSASVDTEAALPKLVGTDNEDINTVAEVLDHEIELDLGYVTTESYDDLPTPPSTPARRARIVQSDSYGGSINYSLRRFSRINQDFDDIIKQCCGVSPVPTATQ